MPIEISLIFHSFLLYQFGLKLISIGYICSLLKSSILTISLKFSKMFYKIRQHPLGKDLPEVKTNNKDPSPHDQKLKKFPLKTSLLMATHSLKSCPKTLRLFFFHFSNTHQQIHSAQSQHGLSTTKPTAHLK